MLPQIKGCFEQVVFVLHQELGNGTRAFAPSVLRRLPALEPQPIVRKSLSKQHLVLVYKLYCHCTNLLGLIEPWRHSTY